MSSGVPLSYPNITLESLDGDLSVVVYLPIGVHVDKNNEQKKKYNPDPFYYSSRFDHGSMIGPITRRRRRQNNNDPPDDELERIRSSNGASATESATSSKAEKHVLYGTDMWRLPHNSHWPESGVGLASEFGVGDDGALCDFRCGWPEAVAVTNGLLGYQEAENGNSFLKIGVGELVKGTCPSCDSTDDYRFNSPYLFAKKPTWNMTRGNSADPNAPIVFEHQASLRNHGYYLKKEVSLAGNALSVTTTLKNLGDTPFSTVWYSHNIFTCDTRDVDPSYSVDINIKGDSNHPVYEEPLTWSWTKPLVNYANVKTFPGSVFVEMTRSLVPGVKIKAEFADDHETTGGFTVVACETAIESRILSPDFSRDSPKKGHIAMYSYNLYIERSTFSPEPQLLINNLMPGEAVSWTQLVVIHDDGFTLDNSAEAAGGGGFATPNHEQFPPNEALSMMTMSSIAGGRFPLRSSNGDIPWSYKSNSVGTQAVIWIGLVLAVGLIALLTKSSNTRSRRRRGYSDIA